MSGAWMGGKDGRRRAAQIIDDPSGPKGENGESLSNRIITLPPFRHAMRECPWKPRYHGTGNRSLSGRASKLFVSLKVQVACSQGRSVKYEWTDSSLLVPEPVYLACSALSSINATAARVVAISSQATASSFLEHLSRPFVSCAIRGPPLQLRVTFPHLGQRPDLKKLE
jgi:hypothetical protein